MKKNTRTIDAFYVLLRAGLWEQEVRLSAFERLDFEALYQLAEEQSVVGLIAAGLEHVEDRKIIKQEALPFMKSVLGIEQRNLRMNAFLRKLYTEIRDAGIFVLLVKGQGVAQCYERPLWRAAGDIDLLLDSDGYERAKILLKAKTTAVKQEFSYLKHIGMTIDSWEIELHGTFRTRLSLRMDREIDRIQESTFTDRKFRTWNCEGMDIFLPTPDNDVIFVFTHILHHYYLEGIGLRQICDWCRLLWVYREVLNHSLLWERLKRMRIVAEWKAFAAFAVDFLSMPTEVMPFFDEAVRWKRKAQGVNKFILGVRSFRYKVERPSERQSFYVRKFFSFLNHLREGGRHLGTFPLGTLRAFFGMAVSGVHAVRKRE